MIAKRITAVSLSLLALAVTGCGGDEESTAGSSATPAAGSAKPEVDIEDFKFVTETVEVEAGGAVTFANGDQAKHNAQTDAGADGAFNTNDLQKGDSKSVTFEEPGTYAYYCIYHRFMTGTVEVSE